MPVFSTRGIQTSKPYEYLKQGYTDSCLKLQSIPVRAEIRNFL